jgi:hypothetical protein
MVGALLAVSLLSAPPTGAKLFAAGVATAAEKQAFLKLLEKLPTEHEGFYTQEAIDEAEPSTRVLLALTEKDVEQYAKGLGVENYCIYPFAALSAGLLERKGPREYGARHFGEIAHPELKLFWGVVLFDKKAAPPEVVKSLRAALGSKEQAKVLRSICGPDFEGFEKRLNDVAKPERPEVGAVEGPEKAVRRRLRGRWQEWEGNEPRPGAKADVCWDFLDPAWVTPNLAVATYPHSEDQQTTYTLGLNVRKEPTWLDLFHDDGGRARVTLTICKFEGDRLILVEGETVSAKAWERTKGDLPGRPKDFRPAEKSGYVRRVLIREQLSRPAKSARVFGYP